MFNLFIFMDYLLFMWLIIVLKVVIFWFVVFCGDYVSVSCVLVLIVVSEIDKVNCFGYLGII